MWVRSDELEQQVLEGVQAPAGVPQGPVRAQLCSQEEQPPLLRDGAQRQRFMQLRHAHSVGLILRREGGNSSTQLENKSYFVKEIKLTINT